MLPSSSWLDFSRKNHRGFPDFSKTSSLFPSSQTAVRVGEEEKLPGASDRADDIYHGHRKHTMNAIKLCCSLMFSCMCMVAILQTSSEAALHSQKETRFLLHQSKQPSVVRRR